MNLFSIRMAVGGAIVTTIDWRGIETIYVATEHQSVMEHLKVWLEEFEKHKQGNV